MVGISRAEHADSPFSLPHLPSLVLLSSCHLSHTARRTIADLIHYRLIHERTVERIAEQPLDSELGQFNLVTYRDAVEGDVHMALTLGTISPEEATLVRVHNMDPLRDLFMVNQEGRWSLRAAMKEVAKAGSGVVLLLGELAEHPRTEHVICVLFDRSKFSERAALQWWREGGREVCER